MFQLVQRDHNSGDAARGQSAFMNLPHKFSFGLIAQVVDFDVLCFLFQCRE